MLVRLIIGLLQKWLGAPPSATLAKCKTCRAFMTLLLQLDGDHPEIFPGHERRIYVFACTRKACRRKDGSIRVIRASRLTGAMATNEASSLKHDSVATVVSKTSPLPEDLSSRSLSANPSSLGDSIFGTKPISSAAGSPNPFMMQPVKSSGKYSDSTAKGNNSAASQSSPEEIAPGKDRYPITPESQPTIEDPLPTFAKAAQISSKNGTSEASQPVEPWPDDKDLPSPYPAYHLEADFEIFDTTNQPLTTKYSMDIDTQPKASSSKSGENGDEEDKDAFESTMDKTFQRFADRLKRNPLQVLRYEFKGSPLLYSKTDSVGRRLSQPHSSVSNSKVSTIAVSGKSNMPSCPSCGANRVFETQLMPQAIAELEVEETSLDGMDWGTIIVGVCEKNCHARDVGRDQVSYLEEWVGVQWEDIGSIKR